MLFNSIDFAIFLPIVFILYWFATNKNLKIQNALIVASSYLFYGWWDWRFLSLILFSTALDFIIGLKISKQYNPVKRKVLLWTSIIVNLGFLGFFKYYNFFVDSFVSAYSFFGNEINTGTLNIILPVGISFYTFQTLSYTLDINKGKLKPTDDFIAFAAFVSFFPQLVAGPIERARNLLPQFYNQRTFDYSKAVDGMRQIIWGLFKKVAIADSCATIVNSIFSNSPDLSGSTLYIGAVLFIIQIYCDFSGYSDIAIGTARLFGFNLRQNFAYPFFARDMAELWRRWHISLTTWFRDYIFIPLSNSKTGKYIRIQNTIIVFGISGLWHGANWTFIIWGLLNALLLVILLLPKKKINHPGIVAKGKVFPSFIDAGKIFLTFNQFALSGVFFRAENVNHGIQYLSDIFSSSFFNIPVFYDSGLVITVSAYIVILFVVEWFGREEEYAIAKIGFTWPRWTRHLAYYSLFVIIIYFALANTDVDFVYFQF